MSSPSTPRPGSPRGGTPAATSGPKVTVPGLVDMKRRGETVAAVTAYDYPTAALADAAGIDLVLVGDSLASVVLGHETTLPVSLEEMMVCLRAVRRGLRRALLVGDLPFGHAHSGGTGPTQALDASIAYLKAGAEAVKLEGGASRCALVRELVDAAIPVMGHIGLTPQSVHAMGGYRVQAKTMHGAERLLEDALALQEAGVFSIVLEGIPAEVARHITESLAVPTVGIGAGRHCDGQILVLHDLLGLTVPPPPTGPRTLTGRKPRFVRQYLDLRGEILGALRAYAGDVRSGQFPDDSESYRMSESETASARAPRE